MWFIFFEYYPKIYLPIILMTPFTTLFIFGISFFLILLSSVLTAEVYYEGKNPWQNFTYAPQHGICEKERTYNLLREPSNAWSDFSYVAIGLIILTIGLNDLYFKRPHPNGSLMKHFPRITILYGIVNIFHGFGSGWFHACRCAEGGIYDQGPMQTVVSFPIFYTIYQQFPKFEGTEFVEKSTHGIFLALYLCFGYLFIYVLPSYIKNEYMVAILVVLILTGFLLHYLWRIQSLE